MVKKVFDMLCDWLEWCTNTKRAKWVLFAFKSGWNLQDNTGRPRLEYPGLSTRLEKKTLPHKAFIGSISCGQKLFYDSRILLRVLKTGSSGTWKKENLFIRKFKEKLASSRKRILISSLYIGTGHLEKDLVMQFDDLSSQNKGRKFKIKLYRSIA